MTALSLWNQFALHNYWYQAKAETLGSLGSNPVLLKHSLEVCEEHKKKPSVKAGLVTELLKPKLKGQYLQSLFLRVNNINAFKIILQKQFLLLSLGPILQTFLGGKVVSLMKLFLPVKLFVVQGYSEPAPIMVNLLEQKDFCALFSKTISGRTHLKRKDWASICVTLTAGPFVSEINAVLVFAEFNNYCLFGCKLEETAALVLFMFYNTWRSSALSRIGAPGITVIWILNQT